MNNHRHALAILIGMITAMSAMAAGSVNIQSDQPANVFFDGEMVGSAPVRLTEIHAGPHTIRVQSQASGQAQDYRISFPRSASVDRQITASFGGAVAPVVVPGAAYQPGLSQAPRAAYVPQATGPVPVQIAAPVLDAGVEVHANLPASVYLDEVYMGRAPLIISRLGPGFHSVKVVADGTGYTRVSPLNVPFEGSYHRRVDAMFHIHYAPSPVIVIGDSWGHHHHGYYRRW